MSVAIRSRWWPGLVVALAVVTSAPRADAKNISLTMSPAASLAGGTLTVQLTVTNKGDEAAQSVVPTLRFLGKEARGKGKPALEPNETLQETLTLPAADLTSGRWPFGLAIDYTDANQYPFQALHVSTVETGSPPPAKVVVPKVETPAISGSGTAKVTVKNLTNAPRTATVALLAPDGLEVTGTPPPIELAAWEEKPVDATIVNRTALGGSRYPVFVTVQYDDGTTHQTAVAQSVVEILPPRSFFAQQRNALWVGAAVLVVLWIGFILWRRPGSAAAGTRA
jgi:hypothetical protein